MKTQHMIGSILAIGLTSMLLTGMAFARVHHGGAYGHGYYGHGYNNGWRHGHYNNYNYYGGGYRSGYYAGSALWGLGAAAVAVPFAVGGYYNRCVVHRTCNSWGCRKYYECP